MHSTMDAKWYPRKECSDLLLSHWSMWKMSFKRDIGSCIGNLTIRSNRCMSMICLPQSIARVKIRVSADSTSHRINLFLTMILESCSCLTMLRSRFLCFQFLENKCRKVFQFSKRIENSKSALSVIKSWQTGMPSTWKSSTLSFSFVTTELKK